MLIIQRRDPPPPLVFRIPGGTKVPKAGRCYTCYKLRESMSTALEGAALRSPLADPARAARLHALAALLSSDAAGGVVVCPASAATSAAL